RPFAALPGNSPAVSLNSTFSLVLARQGGTGKRWDRPPVLASKPDQVLYCRTLGARTAVTRLAVDPAWIGRILSTAVRLGVSRLTAVSSVRKVIARVRRQLARTSTAEPRFELRVAVKHGDRMRCATLIGRSQADATALAAAETARLLIDGDVTTPGAWMPEQVVDPTAFLSRLAAGGLKVEFRETAGELPGGAARVGHEPFGKPSGNDRCLREAADRCHSYDDRHPLRFASLSHAPRRLAAHCAATAYSAASP